MTTDLENLGRKALSGEPADAARYAVALSKAGDAPGARVWMGKAAAAGLPAAIRLEALWSIGGFGAERDIAGGFAMLRALGARGDAEAMLVEARLVADDLEAPRDFAKAATLLGEAAAAGSARARAQINLLAPEAASAAGDWRRAAQAIAWPHERPLPPARSLNDTPSIFRCDGILTRRECAYLIDRARPLLRPAQVVVGAGSSNSRNDVRTNSSMFFSLASSDIVLQSIDTRAALAAGMPAAHGEPLAVLHYRAGETYAPHADWFDPQSDEVHHFGQRARTFVVYLNDAFEGGATAFLRLNIEARGAPGDGLGWTNVTADGAPDPATLHAGLPPTSGEKWLLSKWFRDRPQLPRLA